MMWCLQTWCSQQASEPYAVRQAADVSKDGMTMSCYGGEDTREICGVSYSTVGNEVIPSYTKNVSLACHVECVQPPQVFFQQCPGFSIMKAYCQDTCSIDPQLGSLVYT